MKPTNFDEVVSERISVLRYIMIVGIVILHVPLYVPLTETAAGLFPFIKAFFSHAVFRSSVPVLSCISGYLLFSASLDKRFSVLAYKKTKTLFIPLFLWNFPLVVALYFIQSQGLLEHNFSAQVYPFDIINWLNATFGIAGTPVNYPLSFLRDLFVLALLSPIIGLLLRYCPWVGLIGVGVFFWFNFDGHLIRSSTMPMNFYIGGMAAIMNWNLKRLDRLAIPLLLVFVLACCLIVVFQIEDRRWFRLISPFLIWPFSIVIVNHLFGKSIVNLSRHSFFIFVSHGPVLLMIWMLYLKFLGNYVPYELFWLSAPVLVVLLCQFFHIFAKRLVPGVARLALGTR